MKKERTKGFITGILVMALAIGLIGTAAATVGQRTANLDYKDIKITLNGQAVTPTDAKGNVVEPFSIDGTIYLPVRAVGNALGLEVSWDGNTATAALTGTASGAEGETDRGTVVQNMGIYYDFTNIGDSFQTLAENLNSYFLLSGTADNSQQKTAMDRCDTMYNNLDARLSELLSFVDESDYDIIQNFVDAQTQIVKMKTAVVHYQSYKDDASAKDFTLAYWAALGESAKGIVTADERFWTLYNANRE